MNVVILREGSFSGPSEKLARERTGLYVVQPGETAIRAMQAALDFHSNPTPVVDYRGIDLPPGTTAVFEAEAAKSSGEMPAEQAELHARLARELEWSLEQAQVIGLELPFAEAA